MRRRMCSFLRLSRTATVMEKSYDTMKWKQNETARKLPKQGPDVVKTVSLWVNEGAVAFGGHSGQSSWLAGHRAEPSHPGCSPRPLHRSYDCIKVLRTLTNVT